MDSTENQPQNNKIIPKPWKTLPGPPKPSPKPGISSETEEISPKTGFPQSWGREIDNKPPRICSKPFIKQSLLRIPERIKDCWFKSGIPDSNQGFLIQIRDSWFKSGNTDLNQGNQWGIKEFIENIRIRAPAQKAYKTQGKWSKIKGFEEKWTTNHEKTLPNHEKPSPDLRNPSPKPGFSPKTRKSLPKTRFPQSWARKTTKKPPRTSSKPFIKQSLLRIPEKSGIPRKIRDVWRNQGSQEYIRDS